MKKEHTFCIDKKQRVFMTGVSALAINTYALSYLTNTQWFVIPLLLIFVASNLIPPRNKKLRFRLKTMASGNELLVAFVVSKIASYAFEAIILIRIGNGEKGSLIIAIISSSLLSLVLYFNGLLRIILCSLQISLRMRVVSLVASIVPVMNIIMSFRVSRLSTNEIAMETNKASLNSARKKDAVCRTKYPILFIHGIFFRDNKYIDYWGRIPKELIKNGALVFHGEQESAASVEDCAKQLLKRIETIINESGYEKVNIIAHSKGGLDSRYAISLLGADKYVASLTTINTPHRGCMFAEYLLKTMPEKSRNAIADKYNSIVIKLGDKKPDFLAGVNDLTVSACEEFNKNVPDMPGVFYQSAGSMMTDAKSGAFPLNLTYNIVKKHDGENDGLVGKHSMSWGEKFTFITPKGKTGISHADMVDLNHINIEGFDVREFYVNLVHELKEKGL